MDSNAKELIRLGNQLFDKRGSLLSLWQEIADNFYPEMGEFTLSRSLGSDFASHLTTSFPLLARRDLANAFSAMLRPKETEWFRIGITRDDRMGNPEKEWLEDKTKVMRRAMYDRRSQFVRSTKQGDNDFAAFGQCVISCELNREADGLLYRSWHLRDVAWTENPDGTIAARHRKWKPTARQLATEFRGKVSPKVIEKLDKDPYCEIHARHIVLPAEEYDSPSSKDEYEYIKPGVRKWKQPWVSIYLDVEHEHVMEQVGLFHPVYVIPRWQTVHGSQYAYSPATVAALPDARLIQAMTLTLLEAGQKAVDPPIVATQEAVRSDIQMFAGGVTWVDHDYDEKLGSALRTIDIDSRGIPIGMEMRQDVKAMIAEAFFLNKISLPAPVSKEMTAFETGERIKEYIRNALPLFEPMEMDYNGALCDQTFEILLRAGAFGSMEDMPQSLRNQEIQFRFESPLHEAMEKQKSQSYLQAKALLAEAAASDPSAPRIVKGDVALRDALNAIVPAKWLHDEEEVQAMRQQDAEKQQAMELIAAMQQGGMAAEQIGKAGQAIQGMQ